MTFYYKQELMFELMKNRRAKAECGQVLRTSTEFGGQERCHLANILYTCIVRPILYQVFTDIFCMHIEWLYF